MRARDSNDSILGLELWGSKEIHTAFWAIERWLGLPQGHHFHQICPGNLLKFIRWIEPFFIWWEWYLSNNLFWQFLKLFLGKIQANLVRRLQLYLLAWSLELHFSEIFLKLRFLRGLKWHCPKLFDWFLDKMVPHPIPCSRPLPG